VLSRNPSDVFRDSGMRYHLTTICSAPERRLPLYVVVLTRFEYPRTLSCTLNLVTFGAPSVPRGRGGRAASSLAGSEIRGVEDRASRYAGQQAPKVDLLRSEDRAACRIEAVALQSSSSQP